MSYGKSDDRIFEGEFRVMPNVLSIFSGGGGIDCGFKKQVLIFASPQTSGSRPVTRWKRTRLANWWYAMIFVISITMPVLLKLV